MLILQQPTGIKYNIPFLVFLYNILTLVILSVDTSRSYSRVIVRGASSLYEKRQGEAADQRTSTRQVC